MKTRSGHTAWWLSSIVMLLATACGGSDATEEVSEKKQPQLEIHVFTPEQPAMSRADNGYVAALADEARISSMGIWVFEHATGSLVGYVSPDADDLPTASANTKTYHLIVSDAFAQARPDVDVYVVANVKEGNTGLSLGRSTTREALKAALLPPVAGATGTADYFGLSTPLTAVPTDGLPMSGLLENQPVSGVSPVLNVATNVVVARAVSKVRFLFSSAISQEHDKTLRVNRIDIDAGIIPQQEYLFLSAPYTDGAFHLPVGTAYNATAATLVGGPTDIPHCASPGKFAYAGQASQVYETLLNEALSPEIPEAEREIAQVGLCYLRETSNEKKISGKIYYQIITGGTAGEEKSIAFAMHDNGDFTRNHTWIVYGYFAGGDLLRVTEVTFTPWSVAAAATYEVYNW